VYFFDQSVARWDGVPATTFSWVAILPRFLVLLYA
jgi:hypothetical protein